MQIRHTNSDMIRYLECRKRYCLSRHSLPIINNIIAVIKTPLCKLHSELCPCGVDGFGPFTIIGVIATRA